MGTDSLWSAPGVRAGEVVYGPNAVSDRLDEVFFDRIGLR